LDINKCKIHYIVAVLKTTIKIVEDAPPAHPLANSSIGLLHFSRSVSLYLLIICYSIHTQGLDLFYMCIYYYKFINNMKRHNMYHNQPLRFVVLTFNPPLLFHWYLCSMYSSFSKLFTVNADVGNLKTEFYWSQCYWFYNTILLLWREE